VTCIGLDVTYRCVMQADEFRRRFSARPLRLVRDMAEIWFHQRPLVAFHDPLAAAVIFEPSLCRYATGRVEVELQSTRLAGYTLFDANARPAPHRVATEVASERFFEHYFGVVSA